MAQFLHNILEWLCLEESFFLAEGAVKQNML